MAMATSHKQTSAWTGWVAFAGIMLMLGGLINIVYGLAAIFNQGWYLYAAGDIYLVNLQTWGWAFLAVGVLKIVSGALLMSGNLFGRVMATVLVSLNILANLAFIGIAPFWSALLIAVDALVLYAIIAHGSEMKEA